eukprot:CAMPEP_0174258130 /NCGR_PEP_ID=MMETSP0439-20130205/7188_1 /TAXON_ID=0 /ORGANISM="Stereomyxa ramosa, Strain Chinc5" /LENGTH=137 /DNA_ID=CAMNT_0015341521 /DNA_START=290 /DNA_END=703 /DNA_ORIENTATION=+
MEPLGASLLRRSKQEIVEEKEEEEDRFSIVGPLKATRWENLILLIITPLTFGLGLIIFGPFLEYHSYVLAISEMNVDGRKLTFTGKLDEFMMISLKNVLFTIFTLGLYCLLGYTEQNITNYVDSHIKWADEVVDEEE